MLNNAVEELVILINKDQSQIAIDSTYYLQLGGNEKD